MGSNKRRGEAPIPPNYESLLTEDQIEGLRRLEGFGWDLHFIRRPKFAPIEVILRHSDGQCMQLLENGELDQQEGVSVRTDADSQAEQPQTGAQDTDPWANATDDKGFEIKEPARPVEPPTVNNEPVPTSGGNNKRPPKILV